MISRNDTQRDIIEKTPAIGGSFSLGQTTLCFLLTTNRIERENPGDWISLPVPWDRLR